VNGAVALVLKLVLSLAVAGASDEAVVRGPVTLVGRSEQGRPIVVARVGNPHGTCVLVVGCIHGTEFAGIRIVRALERTHPNADLWLIPNFNPDGYVHGTRQNGRGVDLNANWSSQ
jgi:murein peptide amidase A